MGQQLTLPACCAQDCAQLPEVRKAVESTCCCSTENHGTFLGHLVKRFVEAHDSSMLGVEVHIGDLQIHAHTGRIEVKGLQIDNPPGWQSPYLIKAELVSIDFNLLSLLNLRAHTVEIEELAFSNITLHYEPHLTTSNLSDFVDFLASQSEADEATPTPAQDTGEIVGDEATQTTAKGTGSTASQPAQMNVVLRKVSLKHILAKLYFHDFGPELDLADINFDDFEKQFGGAQAVMTVVRILLTTVAKSAIYSVGSNMSSAETVIEKLFGGLGGFALRRGDRESCCAQLSLP